MIVLCGKTASGKDTIKKILTSFGMKSVVTYTTRPPRAGEIDGVHYHFITQQDFMSKKESGFFLETTSYKVASGETWFYGTAKDSLKDNSVIIMNPDGVKVVKGATIVYILADEEITWNRLRQRGDTPEEARRRLNADDEDFKNIDRYYDFAIRNDGNIPAEEIARMIYHFAASNKAYLK